MSNPASNGLCGGMAFAARDSFEAERSPQTDAKAPVAGALFDYLVDRLFDSIALPFGPARYLGLMSPLLSDGETRRSRVGARSARPRSSRSTTSTGH